MLIAESLGATDAIWLFALGVIIGWVAGALVFGMDVIRDLLWPKRPCPRCGDDLHRITLQDLTEPFPVGAEWYCASCKPPRCFSRDWMTTGKAAPIEEI